MKQNISCHEIVIAKLFNDMLLVECSEKIVRDNPKS